MNQKFFQFSLAKGVGPVTLKKIIYLVNEHFYSWPELISSRTLLREKLLIKDEIIDNIFKEQAHAERVVGQLEERGIEIILETDPIYPYQLKRSLQKKCPPILFALGNTALLNTISVGFCGSRKISPKGTAIATGCSKQLVEKGVTVVSGYAAGTDLAAHRAALEHNGSTVFVLAEGIFHMSYKNDIKNFLSPDNHVFVSQFMPEISWNAGNAMQRNHIIIGLSKAMVLIESGLSGGTFEAGKEALRVNCPLFVVDYAEPFLSSEANPYFLQNGGMPIRRNKDKPNISKLFEVLENKNESISMEFSLFQ